ncbi:MAG: hypothetical protein KC506_01840, partial [Nanoarchaeota archaeon]|nr:hypothetical protein [Nanoarchaeota archaeon]
DKGKDVSELTAIVDEMEILADEAEGVDLTQNKEDLTDLFISIKDDAKELVKNFREAAGSFLSEDDRSALHSRIDTIDRDELTELRGEIDTKRRELHRERVKNLLEDFGEKDEELLRRIEEGRIKSDEIEAELKIKIREKGDEIREEIRIKLRNEAERKRIEVKTRIEEFSRNQVAEARSRIEARRNRIITGSEATS